MNRILLEVFKLLAIFKQSVLLPTNMIVQYSLISLNLFEGERANLINSIKTSQGRFRTFFVIIAQRIKIKINQKFGSFENRREKEAARPYSLKTIGNF